MVYQCALSEKMQHPDWSTHTCLEEAMIKCGRSWYTMPLESLLTEYRENKNADIESYLTQVK
jgi:hypothetical protein